MLLTITLAHEPATDLGFLLGKHPDRVHRTELAWGGATVCFPVADADRCTAAVIVEVDPGRLVSRNKEDAFTLGQHVNDRPYSASSLLSVALSRTLGSALHGRCRDRPELAATALNLELAVPAVRDADGLAARLFTPLGWEVGITPVGSRHVGLRLTGTARLADALSAVYVLLPVLDDAKHHYVGPDEADKLLRAGEAWLPGHPERELITKRYLRYRRRLTEPALERLGIVEDDAPRATPLRELRRTAVLDALRAAGAHRVLDLGCGEGQLLAELLRDPAFTEVVGVDTAAGVLERAAAVTLRLDELPPAARSRITLRQGSLVYTDRSLAGYDAAVLSEVVEHVEPDRLPSLQHAVFGVAAPGTVIVTTPNREYNARYPGLGGTLRHPDHRFEWTRAEFAGWCAGVAAEHDYRVQHHGVGEHDPALGSPTQLAVFHR